MEWFLSASDFLPRTHCGPGWDSDGLVTWAVAAQFAIWLAYMGISGWLAWHKAKLPVSPALWWLFAAFVHLCGWTHFSNGLMFFHPTYRLDTALHVATAIVSLLTLSVLPGATRSMRAAKATHERDLEQFEKRIKDRVKLATLRMEAFPEQTPEILEALREDIDNA